MTPRLVYDDAATDGYPEACHDTGILKLLGRRSNSGLLWRAGPKDPSSLPDSPQGTFHLDIFVMCLCA